MTEYFQEIFILIFLGVSVTIKYIITPKNVFIIGEHIVLLYMFKSKSILFDIKCKLIIFFLLEVFFLCRCERINLFVHAMNNVYAFRITLQTYFSKRCTMYARQKFKLLITNLTHNVLNVYVIARRDGWVKDNCFPPKNNRNNQITVRSIHISQSPSSAASFRDTLSIFNLVYSTTRRRRKQCFTMLTVFYYLFFFYST